MKRFLILSIGIVSLLLVVVTYERLFVEKTFGPAAIAGLSALALLFIMLLASLLLYGTRYRRTVGNAWLAIFSVALTYVAVDLAAGYLLIKPLSPPLVPDKFRHHRLMPNSNVQFTQRDFSYVQRVNNLGMRGEDRPAEKSPDTIRIVTLGDSFTMGKGVEDEETFSVGVERILNERLAVCSSRLTAEVLNGGVDSYAPILSYIQLKRDIAPLKPDLVIHNLDVSDLVQEAAYRKIATYAPGGELIGVPQRETRNLSLTDRSRNWVEKHLLLTRLLLYYVNRAFGYKELTVRDVVTQANFEVAAHTLHGDSVDRSQQWVDLFDSLGKISELSKRIGADYVLTTYPWGHQVNDREWIPGRYTFMPEGAIASDSSVERVATFARASGIRYLDLQPAFRAYAGEAPLYFRYDNHMTVRGQALMAREIADFIGETYLPKWCLQVASDRPHP
ncbi:MAG: SGNH/GDSL hydrolase family protein [Pirellulaceae bacterium]